MARRRSQGWGMKEPILCINCLTVFPKDEGTVNKKIQSKRQIVGCPNCKKRKVVAVRDVLDKEPQIRKKLKDINLRKYR